MSLSNVMCISCMCPTLRVRRAQHTVHLRGSAWCICVCVVSVTVVIITIEHGGARTECPKSKTRNTNNMRRNWIVSSGVSQKGFPRRIYKIPRFRTTCCVNKCASSEPFGLRVDDELNCCLNACFAFKDRWAPFELVLEFRKSLRVRV